MPNNDPLSPVVRGDVMAISAAAWNEVTAAARDRRQPPRPDQAGQPRKQWGCVEALALNSTGAALREHKPAAVTGVGGYTLTGDSGEHWQRTPLLTLGVPAATTDFVVVTLEAIPAGAIGRVAVAGVCLCDVQVGSTSHPFANPIAASAAKLLSGATGQVRLVKAPSTGSSVRCVVDLDGQQPVVPDASSTVAGIVNLTTQTLGAGPKNFVGADTGTGSDGVVTIAPNTAQLAATPYIEARTHNRTPGKTVSLNLIATDSAAPTGAGTASVTMSADVNTLAVISTHTISVADASGTSDGFGAVTSYANLTTATDPEAYTLYQALYGAGPSGVTMRVGTSIVSGVIRAGFGFVASNSTPALSIYVTEADVTTLRVGVTPMLAAGVGYGVTRSGTDYTGVDAVTPGGTFKGGVMVDTTASPPPPVAPSGPAGGSLAGTFPNPTLASSVNLPGTPTATTAAAGTNTTQLATTAFVQAAIAGATLDGGTW